MGDSAISVVATIVACVAAVFVWTPWLRGAVNAHAFTEMIRKLAMAANLDRAVKLCKVAPHSPFATATLAVLETDSADGETLRQRFRETITTRVAATSASWIVVGLVIAAIAVAIAFATPGALPVIGAICGVPALMLIHAYVLARRLARDAVTEGDRVVEAIVTSRARPGSPA